MEVYIIKIIQVKLIQPNEEHAIIGGQVYALRNDLNITTDSNGNKITNVKNLTDYTYSSEPYVLLAYKDINERHDASLSCSFRNK